MEGARPNTPRVAAAQYLASTLTFILAVAARYAATPLLPPTGFPFLSFFPAVLMVSLLTSLGPSLWCAALSTAAAWLLFMAPDYQTAPSTATNIFALAFFAGILVIDCLVIYLMKNAMWQLRRAENQLLLADRRKDDFLALMAHELRNPLHVIRLTTKLLSKKVDASLSSRVAVLDGQSAQMQRLVEDLLDTARMTTGKIKIERRMIDLCAVIRATTVAFQLLATAREQFIDSVLPDHPVWVNGDGARLTQVFENLLSNAAKFSPAGATHQIRLAISAQHVEVVFVDGGRGLAPDQLTKIFGMYVQADGQDANLGGLGLGLSLSQDIVERHDGSITASSEGVGCGSTFLVRLPRVLAPT